MLYYVYQIKGGKSAKQAIRTCSTGGRMTQKKKIVGSLILAGMLIGSNVLWYNHTKELEVKLESRSQAIEVLDTSVKKQAEYVNELKINLQSKNEEISELKGEITKAQQLSYRTMQVKVSAYALNDGLTPNSVMANGEVPYVGCAAMNGLPLGTRVRYNGQIYVIKDRVATDGVLDIFMNSVAECNEFGVRYATIEILD